MYDIVHLFMMIGRILTLAYVYHDQKNPLMIGVIQEGESIDSIILI